MTNTIKTKDLSKITGSLGPWNICPRCKIEMTRGIALRENVSGIPDFIGDDTVCTMSPDGTARLISCLKCPVCGLSRTMT